MGCCFSRPSGPNSPYPGGAANSSARAINPPPLSLPESATQTAPPSPARRRRRDQGPLDQHIDKPLRRHSWSIHDRRWTRRQLDKERAEFFETRVAGRAEIWQTLHAALQQLWEPAPPNNSVDESLATAQTILSAAEISLPTGNLVNGVYDSLGNYYQIPEWVVSDPNDLVEDGTYDTQVAKGELVGGDDGTGPREDDDEEDDENDKEAEERRVEKGKAVVDEREQITVKARLSETGRDYKVNVTKTEPVRSVAKRVAQESSLPSTKKIRIAYMGKILKETSSLEAQGWQPGHIVNALVFNR